MKEGALTSGKSQENRKEEVEVEEEKVQLFFSKEFAIENKSAVSLT